MKLDLAVSVKSAGWKEGKTADIVTVTSSGVKCELFEASRLSGTWLEFQRHIRRKKLDAKRNGRTLKYVAVREGPESTRVKVYILEC